jgi:hypothetical protein
MALEEVEQICDEQRIVRDESLIQPALILVLARGRLAIL